MSVPVLLRLKSIAMAKQAKAGCLLSSEQLEFYNAIFEGLCYGASRRA